MPHRLLSESNFVFRPYQRPFDAANFFQEHAPQWQSLSETLTHWGGATGIDPRVILTTLAITENWPGAEAPDEHAITHIKDEIKRIANQLSQQFYTYKYQKDLHSYSASTLSIINQLNQFSDWQQWNDQYKSWFGGDAMDDAEVLQTQNLKTATAIPTIPEQGFMQWPWRQGFNWIPNGPHSYTGSGYPLSSIDVSYDWPKWGATTYDVAAANAGYVNVLSRCELRITNPNGWSTNYYHMDGLLVQDGQWVDKNTVLGYYAYDKTAALCSGGSSTGPHMHFSVLYNGVYQSIQGTDIWSIQSSGGS
ncbi:M23 family metallopeptidase [Vibrio sp. PP-XX7]